MGGLRGRARHGERSVAIQKKMIAASLCTPARKDGGIIGFRCSTIRHQAGMAGATAWLPFNFPIKLTGG